MRAVATAPAPGESIEVAPGVHWFATTLPFRLRAINQWLLRDAEGWTMIDCGYGSAEVMQQVEAVWARVLDGRRVTRLVVTHHHVDHVANCRWICDRWGIVPTMTRREHDRAEIVTGKGWAGERHQRIAFWQRHGLSEAAAMNISDAWDNNCNFTRPIPETWECIKDGDALQINGFAWHVLVGKGHAPEQALLYSPERKLLISGDQVLTRITPNVSVFDDAPDAEPLTLFLGSNRRIAQACPDVMVLPSHNLPFRGLQSRVKALEHHHALRLAIIEREINGKPQTAAALVPSLFGKLTGHELGFAMGEIIAHLHYLVVQGRAEAREHNGRAVFVARCDGSQR